ncbi:MAG: MFS transporter [Caldilineae bacterium]|nr:MAG: MFS transporter [Caldilineae bacterium]
MSNTIIGEAVRRRLMAALFLAQSMFSAAQIAAFTLMPIIAAELSGTDTAAGVPSTLQQFGRGVAAYPVGWVMGRLGRRLGLSLGYLVAFAGSVLSVAAIVRGSFFWFTAASLLLGMGRGVADQSRYAAADVYEPTRRARAISLVVLAGTVGAVVGPALVTPSTRLAEQLDQNAMIGPFLISALLSFVALILIFSFLRPDPLQIAEREETGLEEAATQAVSLRGIFARRSVQLAVAALVIGQLVMTFVMVITPLHMSHSGHGAGAISLVVMAHTLGMFGLSWGTGWLVDRLGPLVMLIIGGLVLALSAALTPLSTAVPLLALALFLLGLGWNFCFIAGSQMLSLGIAPHERGKVQGASDTLVSAASAVGSLSVGVVFAQGGIVAVAAIGLALSLVYVAASAWGSRHERRQMVVR